MEMICPECGCEMELQEVRSAYADSTYEWVCDECGSMEGKRNDMDMPTLRPVE